jgi:hypothetical protein
VENPSLWVLGRMGLLNRVGLWVVEWCGLARVIDFGERAVGEGTTGRMIGSCMRVEGRQRV